jgi:hypothetical protein
MNTFASFVLAACLAVPAGAAAQGLPEPANALGTWNASFNTQQGVIPATLKLQKNGDKIGGTIASQEGETPVEAEITGKTLKVWFNYQTGGGGPIPIEMTGTIDGDAAKGTMTAGGSPAGDWTATRAKDTKDTKDAKDTKVAPSTPSSPTPSPSSTSSLSGDWNVTLQLDTMTATPALTLKQDGDKLTGEYISQMYGKAPVAGTVKGTEVSFSVSLSVEGNAITALYTGVVQPDGSIKGSVDIGGGAMAGSFTATRKK